MLPAIAAVLSLSPEWFAASRTAPSKSPGRAVKAEPLAVAALDPSALDLEADDPLVGMTEDEVALVVLGAMGVVAVDDARGVEDLPVVGQAVAQGGEDLALRLALEVFLEQ